MKELGAVCDNVVWKVCEWQYCVCERAVSESAESVVVCDNVACESCVCVCRVNNVYESLGRGKKKY